MGAGLILLAALILTVELTYKLQIDSDNGTGMTLLGIGFDASSFKPWAVAVALWLAGALAWRAAVARVHRTWDAVQTEMAARAGGGV